MITHYLYEFVRREIGKIVFMGTVTGTNGDLVQLYPSSAAASNTRYYPKLSSYTSPSAGHEVLVLMGVVLGRIVRTPA